MTSTYENAPATHLLATHCACCNRPLVDSVSVEMGIGPVCRENHGYNVEIDESNRARANVLVHLCAAQRDDAALVIASCGELTSLGFAKLAGKIGERLATVIVEEIDSDRIEVAFPYSEAAIAAVRSVPGRRWDREAKVNSFPVASKVAVFAFLKSCFGGQIGIGPRGPFVIPAV